MKRERRECHGTRFYAVAAIAGRYVQIGSDANTSPVTDVAEAFGEIDASSLCGYRIVNAPKVLRHFTAELDSLAAVVPLS